MPKQRITGGATMIYTHRYRLALSILLFFASISAGGCGEAFPEQAGTYAAAAEVALIAQGLCADASDCGKRQLVFWEGGNPWIPSLKNVFVNLYGIKDPAAVNAVANSIAQSKAGIGGPPCQLTAYSTGHGEPKVKLTEVTIN